MLDVIEEGYFEDFCCGGKCGFVCGGCLIEVDDCGSEIGVGVFGNEGFNILCMGILLFFVYFDVEFDCVVFVEGVDEEIF